MTDELLAEPDLLCLDLERVAPLAEPKEAYRRESGAIQADRGQGEVSDLELVQAVCRGDKRAFEMLYQRYHTPIRRFVYRVNRRLENVDEIINDVMLVVWRKADTFNRTSKVSTWIFGIAYNKALNAGAQWSGGTEVDFDEVEPMLPGVVDAGMREYELQDWLTAALDRLSPDQRAVMELTCLHGMHYEEIAEVLGCPENTVKTRMFHARKKLKQVLPEIGGYEQISADRDR